MQANKFPVIQEVTPIKELIRGWKTSGDRIGFVPTMGYLHQGHLSLIEKARALCQKVVVSIFVNPTQFSDPRDLEKYPRDLNRDLSLLQSCGVDLVFTPTPAQVYPSGFKSWVEVQDLPNMYEGADRPGHFRGVSTVVSSLFHIVEPDVAVFGEKDFQQLRIIEQMVQDLHFPVKVVRGETLREEDGLAMSSRNVRLSPDARQIATTISKALTAAKEKGEARPVKVEELKAIALAWIAEQPSLYLHYFELVRESDLSPVEDYRSVTPLTSPLKGHDQRAGGQTTPLRLLVAASLEGIRLLDNMSISVYEEIRS